MPLSGWRVGHERTRVRPRGRPENAFGAFGLPGSPVPTRSGRRRGRPSSVPADDGGWVTLFLWRGSPATIVFESWSEPVPLRRWGERTAGTPRCACPRGCG